MKSAGEGGRLSLSLEVELSSLSKTAARANEALGRRGDRGAWRFVAGPGVEVGEREWGDVGEEVIVGGVVVDVVGDWVVEVGARVEVVGVVVSGVAGSSGGAVVLARARHRP